MMTKQDKIWITIKWDPIDLQRSISSIVLKFC